MSPLGMANQYMFQNVPKLNTQYRHIYHANAPLGWMNDPNGFIYAMDNYHLFYQFYPYKATWGPMHWGHYTTKDFVKWELKPIALAPDQIYDKELGCFSGTAMEEDGKLYVMYTGTSKSKGKEEQQQCLAVSEDGITFIKMENNPVITTEQIPEGYSKVDFRDPKIFKQEDTYYCLVGCKNISANTETIGGEILLYQSINMMDWQFVGPLMHRTITATGVLECPDMFRLNGKDILICSPQNMECNEFKYSNSCSAVYFIGNLDLKTGKFSSEVMDEIDGGFDFYAPQTLKAPDGRIIVTAWMNMWERSYPTAEHGWMGAAILPRELTLKGDRLYQAPVREIESYRTNKVLVQEQFVKKDEIIIFDGVEGDTIELILEVDLLDSKQFFLKLFKGRKNETLLYYDRASDYIVFDRIKSGESITVSSSERPFGTIRKTRVTINDNILKMRLFLDKCSVEAFFQDGERTLTSTVFPDMDDKGVEFYSIGGDVMIKKLEKYDILVLI